MKTILTLLIAVFLLTACSTAPSTPPPGAVSTAVAQTVAARTAAAPAATATPIPTNTTPPAGTTIPAETLALPTDTPSVALPTGAECIPTNIDRVDAQVTHVVDGDTIDVEIDGQTYRVRYIGMDTPEATSEIEYFGPQATAFNEQLVAGKTVKMIKDVSETDRFGRLLRYVIVDGFFVNYELVKQGFATAATFPPDVACQEAFREAERVARQEERGLWGGAPTPVSEATPTHTLPPQPTATLAPVVQLTSPPQSSGCLPSYPTVCIPPPPPDLDCRNVSFRRFQVLPPDPHRFDGDSDGVGCEA